MKHFWTGNRTMRIERGTLAIVVLAAGIAATDAPAQGPRPGQPQVEVRSLFGGRQLGWPMTPKPRQFGGGGAFGPRDLGRGFSPRPSWSLTEDFPPQPSSPNRYRLGIGARGDQPVQGVPPEQLPGEPLPEWTVPIEPSENGGPSPSAQVAEDGAVVADQAEGSPLEGESVPRAEPSSDQTGRAMGQPAESGVQPTGGVATSGEAPMGGVAGEVGSAIPAAPPGGRPSFRWNTNSLRMLPAESRLAERLQGALGNRLRVPLDVSIEHETAILRGAVATEYDRTLAGHLARFEPGVRNVKNELSVAPGASSPKAQGPMRIRLSAE